MDKKQLKTLTDFSQDLSDKDEVELKEEIKEKNYMDNANVMMVSTKNKTIQGFLSNKHEAEKKPDLKLKGYQTTSYSTEYLLTIIKLFQQFDDSVTLGIKKDFPLIVKGSKFEIILAPRISNE